MKSRVIIESPFGRNPDGSKCTPEQYARNTVYVHRCLRHSLEDMGEAPFAGHALYTVVLDDTDLDHRKMGMEAGWAWGYVAHFVAVYMDYGMTEGMQAGIDRWEELGLKIIYRQIGLNTQGDYYG